MSKSVTIGIVVVVVLAGGYLLFNKSSLYKSSATSTAKTAVANTNTDVKVAATITYANNGFSPSLTTVKSGDVVAVTNTSSSDLQMQSNPHPAHTDDTDLNVGVVKSGATANFTVTKTGTFGFHNHLNPSDTAEITIQ